MDRRETEGGEAVITSAEMFELSNQASGVIRKLGDKIQQLETALTAACERNGNLSVELAAMTAERDKDYAGMREMQAKFVAASQALAAAQDAVKRRDDELDLCYKALAFECPEGCDNDSCRAKETCEACWKNEIAAKLKEGV